MEAIRGQRTADTTRLIVYAGLTGAAYALATIALAPIGYGPIQFRVAGLLKPLALVSPIMGLGLSVGVALANLFSPFGAWDFVAMPFFSYIASITAYRFRDWPWFAMVLQALMVSVAVALFPLHMGGGIPVWPTVAFVFVSECTLYLIGYAVLRKTPLWEQSQ